MIEQAFGQSSPWSLGVEEELMILDAPTLGLAPEVETLIAAARDGLPGLLKTELLASWVELNTRVCDSAADAVAVLAELRRAAGEAAAAHGLALAGSGSHPFSVPEAQAVVPEERYESFIRYAGVSARRQGVAGLHVHVGMPSAAASWHALEGVLPWLPLVLALSANSPYLAGDETGLASCRAEVLAQLPRSGAPPALGSYAEWERFVERIVALGLAEDYTRFWWDVRPHPRFGTLEVRMPDQPTALARTGAFVALLQALAVTVLQEPLRAVEPGDRALYAQNRWAALRFGAEAELVHPDGDRLVRARELAEELLARVERAADELGTKALLEPLAGPTEGERQLEVGRARGLQAVCADLVERTLGSR